MLHVDFRQRNGRETWWRDFSGRVFASELSMQGGQLTERFGPLRFAFALSVEDGDLAMILRGWRAFGIPLPLALAPRTTAREWEAEDRFHFDVSIGLPRASPVADGVICMLKREGSGDARRAVFGLFGSDTDAAFMRLDAQTEARGRLGRLLLWLPALFLVSGMTFALVGDKYAVDKATPWAALLPYALLLGGAAEPGHATLGIAGVILFFLIVNWKFTAFVLAIGLGALLVMSGGAGLLIFTAIMNI